MTPERWKRISGVFAEALNMAPAARPAYIERQCSGHPEDVQVVRQLLDRYDQQPGSAPHLDELGVLGHDEFDDGDEDGLVGRRIGVYEVTGKISAGGQCKVYRATDTRLGRQVAVKALPARVARDPARRERLVQEARAAASLSHANIAAVYALEEDGDDLFMISEFVGGRNLREVMETGSLKAEVALRVLQGVAEALAAAHTRGVVHRDVKPENVMLPEADRPKLLDFGLAQVRPSVTAALTRMRLTRPGMLLGTFGYMAPEQARGDATDARTDVFAWGVLAYEVLTGHAPFGHDLTSLLRVQNDRVDLAPVRALGRRGLDAILDRCLQKAPADRYASCVELAEALKARHSRVVEVHVSEPEASDPLRWWRIHQASVAAVYALALLPLAAVAARAPAALPVFFVALVAAVVVVSLRLNFAFLSRLTVGAAREQRQRWRALLLVADLAYSAALATGAWLAVGSNPLLAGVLTAVAVGLLVAAFVIEPATAREAFRGLPDRGPGADVA